MARRGVAEARGDRRVARACTGGGRGRAVTAADLCTTALVVARPVSSTTTDGAYLTPDEDSENTDPRS